MKFVSPFLLYTAASIAILSSPAFATSTLILGSLEPEKEEAQAAAPAVPVSDATTPAEPVVSGTAVPAEAATEIPLGTISSANPEVKAETVATTPTKTPATVAAKKVAGKKAAPAEVKAPLVEDEDHSTMVIPIPTPEGDAKFKAALEYVYENHPQIKAEREALKVADEGVAQAVSGFRPDARADYSTGRQRNNNLNDRWNYDNAKARDLVVTQPIFSGGGTIASFMTAKERVKAARANLAAVEQQVLYNATVAYTDVVEKDLVLQLNQKNVDLLKKQMDVTQARFDVGELTVTDTAQAAARLAQAEADEKQALGDYGASLATFRRVMGFDVDGNVTMPSVPGGIPQTIAEAKEWAYSNNPVLEAARRNENAAYDNVYVNAATLLPTVNIQGVMSRADGNSLSALNRIDEDSIKVNLSIPIYQSGAEWSRLREARNLAQQAKFNAMDTNASVVEGVSLAWESFNTSKAIIVSNQAAVSAAQTALNGVRKENEFGVRTILDVLNAEQESFFARVNLVKAIRNEKIQAYRLLASVGKLTSRDLDLKTNVPNPKEHYNSVKYQLLGL